MFTVFKFFALVVAIYSCYIHFLWGIRCLYAIPFVQTNQYLLQIFTSQRRNVVKCFLSYWVTLQSRECQSIPLIGAIKECRQFHSVCLLLITIHLFPNTKSIVTMVYQKNLEHCHVRFMCQCLATSHYTITARPPVMVTNADAVTYIIYATAQIHHVIEWTIDICQHRSNAYKCQNARTTCLFQ